MLLNIDYHDDITINFFLLGWKFLRNVDNGSNVKT